MAIAGLEDGYTLVPAGKLAAVVTFLEMRRPPALPETEQHRFDIARVVSPETGWYRTLFRQVGESWLWFSRLRMRDEELAAIIRHEAVDVFVLREGGADKGLLELDRRRFPEIEIAFLGVVPQIVGRGAGRALMHRALKEAWQYAPERVTLHTCTLDHPAALGFYLKWGFQAVRRAVEVSDDPRLTGEIPRECAPQIPLL